MLLLKSYDLMEILEEQQPVLFVINKKGAITINPNDKEWSMKSQRVLSILTSSLSNSVLPKILGKATEKRGFGRLNQEFH